MRPADKIIQNICFKFNKSFFFKYRIGHFPTVQQKKTLIRLCQKNFWCSINIFLGEGTLALVNCAFLKKIFDVFSFWFSIKLKTWLDFYKYKIKSNEIVLISSCDLDQNSSYLNQKNQEDPYNKGRILKCSTINFIPNTTSSRRRYIIAVIKFGLLQVSLECSFVGMRKKAF